MTSRIELKLLLNIELLLMATLKIFCKIIKGASQCAAHSCFQHHPSQQQTSNVKRPACENAPPNGGEYVSPHDLYPKGPGWRGQRYTSHIYGDLKCIRERGAWSALPCLFNLAEDPNKLSGMHGARYDIFTADNKSWN